MQFLTVGRSFGGAKEGPNRYRLNEQCLLPKFGKPNPVFRTTTPIVPADVSVTRSRIGVGETGSLFDLPPKDSLAHENLPASWSSRLEHSPVMVRAASAVSTLFGESSRAEAVVKSMPSTAAIATARPGRKAEVAQPELPVLPAPNPFASPFASPSAPAVVTEPSKVPPPRKKWQWLLEGMLYTRRKNVSTRRSPVQREWSLGGVTVVRNDLSDADLEVVPAGSVSRESARRPVAEPV
ncbi:MAG: hypothetical protein H7X97_05730, partial [Opitutaceae bacterium]|nr:hypothetical protein [Verrucomicrobiales bacterium]